MALGLPRRLLGVCFDLDDDCVATFVIAGVPSSSISIRQISMFSRGKDVLLFGLPASIAKNEEVVGSASSFVTLKSSR